jgi:hypothetical protein
VYRTKTSSRTQAEGSTGAKEEKAIANGKKKMGWAWETAAEYGFYRQRSKGRA